jgi:hypothetical protein
MRFSSALLTSALCRSTIAAPIAQPVAEASPQLLNDLSPDVAGKLELSISSRDATNSDKGLVTALGLGSLAPSLYGILNTAGTDVKSKRSPQLLNDLSPDVAGCVQNPAFCSIHVAS